MNNLIFESATKVFFGRGCVKGYLACLTKNVSLKKKTVIPFSTSISSGLGSSGKHLKARAQISSKTKWLKGRNFYDVPSQKTVNKWVKKLKY